MVLAPDNEVKLPGKLLSVVRTRQLRRLLADSLGSCQPNVRGPNTRANAGIGKPRRPGLMPFQPTEHHSVFKESLNNVRATLSLLHKPQRSSLIIKNVEGLPTRSCYFLLL